MRLAVCNYTPAILGNTLDYTYTFYSFSGLNTKNYTYTFDECDWTRSVMQPVRTVIVHFEDEQFSGGVLGWGSSGSHKIMVWGVPFFQLFSDR